MRISGVTVGTVVALNPTPQGETVATIQMQPRYAPVHADARAILRAKTLLGETFVAITPGSRAAPAIPEGGTLGRGQVAPSVQLDEIYRTFDPKTRAAFQTWMIASAAGINGQGAALNAALGELDPFVNDLQQVDGHAAKPERRRRCARAQHGHRVRRAHRAPEPAARPRDRVERDVRSHGGRKQRARRRLQRAADVRAALAGGVPASGPVRGRRLAAADATRARRGRAHAGAAQPRGVVAEPRAAARRPRAPDAARRAPGCRRSTARSASSSRCSARSVRCCATSIRCSPSSTCTSPSSRRSSPTARCRRRPRRRWRTSFASESTSTTSCTTSARCPGPLNAYGQSLQSQRFGMLKGERVRGTGRVQPARERTGDARSLDLLESDAGTERSAELDHRREHVGAAHQARRRRRGLERERRRAALQGPARRRPSKASRARSRTWSRPPTERTGCGRGRVPGQSSRRSSTNVCSARPTGPASS